MKTRHLALGFALGALAGGLAGRRADRSFPGRVVLVTGGSRGLGLELAREFGRRGARVAICARDDDTLARAREDLARRGVSVFAMPADIGDPAQAGGVVRAVLDRWDALDVLVNNAGTITVGPLETMRLGDFEEHMRTNFWGAVNVTLAALPHMRARGDGRIVDVVSIGGQVAVPHLLPYDASKFALAGFSEGLAAEAAPWGISVTTVYPGLMRTGSPRNALFKGRHRAEYAWFSISDAIPGLAMDVTRAAGRIVDACHRRDRVVTLTLPARLAAAVHAAAPGLTIGLLALAARLLPAPGGVGTDALRGRDSESRWSPSLLTAPGERAARSQNQVAG
jgi:NAD(P)-dependent dehydrogenase (short-subunit alcohol dehydrogenase family)